MNSYTTKLHGRCPYAPIWDYYELTVESLEFIRTERIEEVADELRGQEITQEEMAERAKEKLPESCRIKLVGDHFGCKTEVTL